MSLPIKKEPCCRPTLTTSSEAAATLSTMDITVAILIMPVAWTSDGALAVLEACEKCEVRGVNAEQNAILARWSCQTWKWHARPNLTRNLRSAKTAPMPSGRLSPPTSAAALAAAAAAATAAALAAAVVAAAEAAALAAAADTAVVAAAAVAAAALIDLTLRGAAAALDPRMLACALRAGADPASTSTCLRGASSLDRTALMLACMSGGDDAAALAIVETLLATGRSCVEHRTQRTGITALMLASQVNPEPIPEPNPSVTSTLTLVLP